MIPVKDDGPARTVDTNETNTKQNKIEKNRLMSVNKNNVSAIYIAAVVVSGILMNFVVDARKFTNHLFHRRVVMTKRMW